MKFSVSKTTLLKAGKIYSRYFFRQGKYRFPFINMCSCISMMLLRITPTKMKNYSGKNYVFFKTGLYQKKNENLSLLLISVNNKVTFTHSAKTNVPLEILECYYHSRPFFLRFPLFYMLKFSIFFQEH